MTSKDGLDVIRGPGAISPLQHFLELPWPLVSGEPGRTFWWAGAVTGEEGRDASVDAFAPRSLRFTGIVSQRRVSGSLAGWESLPLLNNIFPFQGILRDRHSSWPSTSCYVTGSSLFLSPLLSS